ncbi:hypothetical protein WG66_015514, partial [Moniliophthora roreri]
PLGVLGRSSFQTLHQLSAQKLCHDPMIVPFPIFLDSEQLQHVFTSRDIQRIRLLFSLDVA